MNEKVASMNGIELGMDRIQVISADREEACARHARRIQAATQMLEADWRGCQGAKGPSG